MKRLGLMLVFLLSFAILSNLVRAFSLQDIITYFSSLFQTPGKTVKGGMEDFEHEPPESTYYTTTTYYYTTSTIPTTSSLKTTTSATTTTTTTTTTITPLPDLSISSGDISYSVFQDSLGTQLNLRFIIHNLGNTASSSPWITVYDNNVSADVFNPNEAIPAGGQINTGFGYYPSLGIHNIRVVIDPNNNIVESNENNNIAEKTIAVTTSTITTTTIPPCGYGTATATTPVTYNNVKFYAVQGATSWAKIQVRDQSGNILESLTINSGESKDTTSSNIFPTLRIKVFNVDASPDGTVNGASLGIGYTEAWCGSCISGTATATSGVVYGGDYFVYATQGSANSWAQIVVKKGGNTVQTKIVNQGESWSLTSDNIKVAVGFVNALQDGTIVGADLLVGPAQIDCSKAVLCTDSDGGKNYYKKGDVSGVTKCSDQSKCITPSTVSDSCLICDPICHESGTTLSEYFCDGRFRYVESHTCPNGCKDGACIVKCTGIEMVWYLDGKEIRREAYNYTSDGCGGGFRCLTGNEIDPSCYSLQNCQNICKGECVDISAAAKQCETKCAKEGEYNSGPVSPEYYYGCCLGLEGFNTRPGLVGGGALCYDPTKGIPVCKAVGTRLEGWYYSITGGLLRYESCSETFRQSIIFYSGWNMFSNPVNTVIPVSEFFKQVITTTIPPVETSEQVPSIVPMRTCTYDSIAGKVWHYSNGKYEETSLLNPGEGYWVKMKNYCFVEVEGKPVVISDFPTLNTGWNQIGSPSESVQFSTVAGNCKVAGGPWKYNAVTKQYEKSDYLMPGIGYWVNVESQCKLGESETPPLPPVLGSIIGKILGQMVRIGG